MNSRVVIGCLVVATIIGGAGYVSLASQWGTDIKGKEVSSKVKGTSSMPIGNTVVRENKGIVPEAVSTDNSTQANLEPDAATSNVPQVKNPKTIPSPAPKPNPNPTPSTIPTPAPAPSPSPTPAPKSSGYTSSQVSAHADASSCWSIINGSVYDLTDYISRHPGGSQRIINICGSEGTKAFNGQHSGNRKAQSTLANYRLGTFVN